MRKPLVLGLAWAFGLTAQLALPALALPGATVDQSIKVSRPLKRDLMGVTYLLKNGRVMKESWNSEMKSWDLKTADRLRALAVGKRKLASKKTLGNAWIVWKYTDGVEVKYNVRRDKVIAFDVLARDFSQKDLEAGKYQQVSDWKEAPYKGKKW